MKRNLATLVDRSHDLSAALIRPFSMIRGAGRVSKFLNLSHLALGATPIKTAKFQDGVKLKVDLRSQTEWYSYYSGVYDDQYINIINRLIAPGGNVLDVGSNIGFYCLRVARSLADSQTVFCFEPVPTNYARLQENIRLNGLTLNVRAFDFGLSDRECVADITLRDDFRAGAWTGNAAMSISPEADKDFDKLKVQLRRLDDLILNVEFGDVRVVKVDIEGHEDLFLAGAQKFLELQRPIIFCEINKPYYRWRKVRLNEIFEPLIPMAYSMLRFKESRKGRSLEQVQSFEDLLEIENVYFCPNADLDALYNAVSY